MLIAVLFFVVIFLWLLGKSFYWRFKNIPYYPSPPLIGSFKNSIFQKKSVYDDVKEIYEHKNVYGKPFFGINLFVKPALMICEPELIKRILVKDFNSFCDRYASVDEKSDPIGHYISFTAKQPFWQSIRSKFSPFFSTGKLKQVFVLVERESEKLVQKIHKSLEKQESIEFEVKEIVACYSTDIIASCGFGVESNSINNPNDTFRLMGRYIMNMTLYRSIEMGSFFLAPYLSKIINFKIMTTKGNQFIRDMVGTIIAEREKSGVHRPDLIDTVMQLKKVGTLSTKEFDIVLTDEMLLAQVGQLFLAAYETTSAITSFALYEITKQPEIQNRLRQELVHVLDRNNGKWSYESIFYETPYLSMIINEVMRLYPVLPMLDRKCCAPSGFSLEPYSNFVIPKDMPVYIPIFGLHRDAKYFPEPDKFDPERFSEANKNKIIPYTYMPFGEGPHNCIGERMGYLQMKMAVARIVKDFILEPTDRTPEVIKIKKLAFVVQSESGIYINFKRIRN